MDKKKVLGHVPFDFLNEMGYDTRAMERFFELPRDARETLLDTVSTADEPEARAAQALKSLAQGGEGYCEEF